MMWMADLDQSRRVLQSLRKIDGIDATCRLSPTSDSMHLIAQSNGTCIRADLRCKHNGLGNNDIVVDRSELLDALNLTKRDKAAIKYDDGDLIIRTIDNYLARIPVDLVSKGFGEPSIGMPVARYSFSADKFLKNLEELNGYVYTDRHKGPAYPDMYRIVYMRVSRDCIGLYGVTPRRCGSINLLKSDMSWSSMFGPISGSGVVCQPIGFGGFEFLKNFKELSEHHVDIHSNGMMISCGGANVIFKSLKIGQEKTKKRIQACHKKNQVTRDQHCPG